METATMTTTKWNLDTAHSEISFKVKHMMIANVTGSFSDFSVNAITEGNEFSTAKVEFSANIDSINTGNVDRDNHLKSADFFNGTVYPQLKFESSKFERRGDQYVLHGHLLIKEIKKPIELNVDFGGIGKDPWGNQKAGFSISGKINRADFGLTWNAALETGGVLVGEDVKLHAEIQLIKNS